MIGVKYFFFFYFFAFREIDCAKILFRSCKINYRFSKDYFSEIYTKLSQEFIATNNAFGKRVRFTRKCMHIKAKEQGEINVAKEQQRFSNRCNRQNRRYEHLDRALPHYYGDLSRSEKNGFSPRLSRKIEFQFRGILQRKVLYTHAYIYMHVYIKVEACLKIRIVDTEDSQGI